MKRHTKLYLAMAFASCFASGMATAKPLDGQSTDILMQGFHWNSANGSWWSTLGSNAQALSNAGIDMLWFPPASQVPSFSLKVIFQLSSMYWILYQLNPIY